MRKLISDLLIALALLQKYPISYGEFKVLLQPRFLKMEYALFALVYLFPVSIYTLRFFEGKTSSDVNFFYYFIVLMFAFIFLEARRFMFGNLLVDTVINPILGFCYRFYAHIIVYPFAVIMIFVLALAISNVATEFLYELALRENQAYARFSAELFRLNLGTFIFWVTLSFYNIVMSRHFWVKKNIEKLDK